MSEQDLTEPIPTAATPPMGMARFFTRENLDRYRMLAGEVTDADQRRQILTALSGEMTAFRTESAKRVRSALPTIRPLNSTLVQVCLNDDNICPSI